MTIQPLPPSGSSEKRSEILYGVENAVGRGIYFMSNVKRRMDIYFDHRAPSIVVEVPEYSNGYINIRKRGGKIRAFTEITKDNMHYCKELMKLVDELRHLDGVKGGIAVSESEYMATTVLEEAKPLTQVIFSSVKEVVEQGQYIFDTLWNTSIPAEQKIREIEEGVVPIRTRLLENQDEIIREIKRLNNGADNLSICSGFGGMQMSYNYFFDSYKRIVERYRRAQKGDDHDGLRWIINIDKDSMDLVKIFLEAGIQIRHIKNMPAMNFGVSDKEIALTIEKMEGGNVSQSFLISNEHLYVNHFNSLFEELWKNGIVATERIRDIEAGVDLADIEVIPNSAKTQDRYLNIVRSALEEILWIFPTPNAFIRQNNIGAIQLAKQAAKEKNVKVRILVPADSLIEQKVQQLKQSSPDHIIDIRYIEQMSETKATILVVDRKASLVMELRDDAKTTFVEAIGLSTYSNSKAGVLSYVAIFENLWIQSDLYEQLKRHDKMQKDFINIAAHELRTPIQPILGLTETLRSHTKDIEQAKLLEVVSRNAKRLQRLTEDILDVTKIESQSLNLKKERFNLNDAIVNTIDDIMINKQSSKTEKNLIKVLYPQPQDIFVEADIGRISQVIHNLLDNALKFTKVGTITINTQMKKEDKNDDDVVVSVTDTGEGIDAQILPRLFTKFATRSETGGTGLGLFVSKSIVEAHGGRIWTENNNAARKGAKFAFSLPISRQQTAAAALGLEKDQIGQQR